MKKAAIIILALCVVAKFVAEETPKVFYLNVTSSLPTGLYMKIPGKECRRGDYIVYEPSEETKALIIKNG